MPHLEIKVSQASPFFKSKWNTVYMDIAHRVLWAKMKTLVPISDP